MTQTGEKSQWTGFSALKQHLDSTCFLSTVSWLFAITCVSSTQLLLWCASCFFFNPLSLDSGSCPRQHVVVDPCFPFINLWSFSLITTRHSAVLCCQLGCISLDTVHSMYLMFMLLLSMHLPGTGCVIIPDEDLEAVVKVVIFQINPSLFCISFPNIFHSSAILPTMSVMEGLNNACPVTLSNLNHTTSSSSHSCVETTNSCTLWLRTKMLQ